MKQPRPRIRPGIVILGLVLILAVLIGAACAPSTPAAPSQNKPTQPAPTTNAPAAEKAGPVAPGAVNQPARPSNLPVGVDADGNFYRGDPNAPVKLIEFSDFQ
jgi:protein-disulfide isomerase